jgi:alginate O-acetyltransferase complex protein AlgI
MIFTQLVFFGFFLVTFLVHWALRGHRARKVWLLLCSFFFYGYWDYRFLALILFSTALDYWVGLLLERTQDERARRVLITCSLVANLGLLGFFKYYDFFVDSGLQLAHALGLPLEKPSLQVVLPVGISFFTFQTMSYTIDVYRRQLPARRSFLDFALFVAFFPQLVAGPIVRAADFLPQLDRTPRFADVDGRRALLLFALGYFKKACVADNIASAIDPLFANPVAHDAADRVLGAVLYSVQIYCDFSGYSDMAIATAALLGYRLVRNFDAPYLSRNVREFWQRWHISLSSWLRDYLYIPLGGNRGGRLFMARNLMLTMLLGGLWHGANWTFVLWGFLHGVALIAHRVWQSARGPARAETLPGRVASWALTFAWVAFCFTIFRCPDFATAAVYFSQSAAPAGAQVAAAAPGLSPDWWLALALLGAVHHLLAVRRERLIEAVHRLHDRVFYPAFGAACAALPYLTPISTEPFIYFQF